MSRFLHSPSLRRCTRCFLRGAIQWSAMWMQKPGNCRPQSFSRHLSGTGSARSSMSARLVFAVTCGLLTGVNRSFRSTTNKFPYRFNRDQQQSELWEKGESRGLCGISKGGGKRGKPVVGFPLFPRTGFFHSSAAAAFYVFVVAKKVARHLASPDSKPASRFFLASSMR